MYRMKSLHDIVQRWFGVNGGVTDWEGQSYEESVCLDYHFDVNLLKRNIMIAIVSHSRNPEGLPFVGNKAGHAIHPVKKSNSILGTYYE